MNTNMHKFRIDERDGERKQRELRFEHASRIAERAKCDKCGTRMMHSHRGEEGVICCICQRQINKEMDALDALNDAWDTSNSNMEELDRLAWEYDKWLEEKNKP